MAGPAGDIGRGAPRPVERGDIFDFADRRPFAADFARLALRPAPRLAFTALRPRADTARLALRPLVFALLAFRLFAIMASRSFG